MLHGWMNGWIKCAKYMPCIHSRKDNSAICYNMEAPEGHYVKWNKLVTEGQIPSN